VDVTDWQSVLKSQRSVFKGKPEMSEAKRKNMKPEARRNQLIDCGEALFFSKGFDATTIQDVLDMAGISKGGFYHQFKSKDELLFGVIYRSAEVVINDMRSIAEDTSVSPLSRLHQFLHLETKHVQANSLPDYLEVFRVMNDPKSSVLLNQLRRYIRLHSKPLLARILQSGVEAGEFTVEDTETAAELVLYTSEFFFAALSDALAARGTDLASDAADRLRAVMDMQFLTVDRILGLPDKTTSFGWPDYVDAVMATNARDV
jgi:AcrR family transcriptional regulator